MNFFKLGPLKMINVTYYDQCYHPSCQKNTLDNHKLCQEHLDQEFLDKWKKRELTTSCCQKHECQYDFECHNFACPHGYCSDHSCPEVECPYHTKCRIRLCPEHHDDKQRSPYCQNHTCQARRCRQMKDPSGDYCHDHVNYQIIQLAPPDNLMILSVPYAPVPTPVPTPVSRSCSHSCSRSCSLQTQTQPQTQNKNN